MNSSLLKEPANYSEQRKILPARNEGEIYVQANIAYFHGRQYGADGYNYNVTPKSIYFFRTVRAVRYHSDGRGRPPGRAPWQARIVLQGVQKNAPRHPSPWSPYSGVKAKLHMLSSIFYIIDRNGWNNSLQFGTLSI